MQVSAYQNVGYTENGNPYQKSNAGKAGGELAGTVAGATVAYKLIKNGSVANALNKGVTYATSKSPKLGAFLAKHPKLLKYGAYGLAAGAALWLANKIGGWIGGGVDKVIDNKRAKAADEAANSLNYNV